MFVREQNTQKTAKSLGLVGWVRNTEQKTVEGVAQGEEGKLAEMWVYGWWENDTSEGFNVMLIIICFVLRVQLLRVLQKRHVFPAMIITVCISRIKQQRKENIEYCLFPLIFSLLSYSSTIFNRWTSYQIIVNFIFTSYPFENSPNYIIVIHLLV